VGVFIANKKTELFHFMFLTLRASLSEPAHKNEPWTFGADAEYTSPAPKKNRQNPHRASLLKKI
jgi:hypothetical protein